MRRPEMFSAFFFILTGSLLLKYGMSKLKSDPKYETVQAKRTSFTPIGSRYINVYEADECSNPVIVRSKSIGLKTINIDKHKETGKCRVDNKNMAILFIILSSILIFSGVTILLINVYNKYATCIKYED